MPLRVVLALSLVLGFGSITRPIAAYAQPAAQEVQPLGVHQRFPAVLLNRGLRLGVFQLPGGPEECRPC